MFFKFVRLNKSSFISIEFKYIFYKNKIEEKKLVLIESYKSMKKLKIFIYGIGYVL